MSAARRRIPVPALLLALAALVASWALPAAASAVPVDRIWAGPVTASSVCNPWGDGVQSVTDAGSVTDFCFALHTKKVPATGDDLQTTTIDSPTGVLANVDSAPMCTVADFAATSKAAAKCATNTQVGVSTASIRAQLTGSAEVPLKIKGEVFNLTHTVNEVGLLGIQLDPELLGIKLPKVKIVLRFTLRPSPDVGLRAVASGLPRTADTGLLGIKPIAVDTFTFRFWGSKLDHPTMPVSFTRLGSACDTAVSKISAVSYSGEASSQQETYTPTNCQNLRIGQTATVTTSEKRPDVPTETVVHVMPAAATDPDHFSTVNPSKAVVSLPPGLMLGAQGAAGADGLPLCSNEAFALTSNAAPTCPAASAVGTVEFISPNLKVPFTGKAYLGEQTGPNKLPELMISTDEGGTAPDAPRVKLLGVLTVDADGRLVTTLSGLPDVPFTSFLLTFRGGDNGVISTPRSCGTGTGTSVLLPPDAATPSSTTSMSLTIDQDCVDPAAFAPTLGAAFQSTAAGQSGVPTITIARPDRTARLGKAVVHLPPGMLASLKGVPECGAADAAAGSCPDATKVGSVVVQAGVGPTPKTTPTGSVFLTARPDGAVAGLSIAAKVAFGAVDLGTLIVPARIDLRQSDYGLDLTTAVPSTFLDIPLNLRSMAVTLDRPGFSKNPTSCAPLTLSADLTSDLGTTGSPTAPVQATDCGALPFSPDLKVSLPAGLKTGDSAGLTVDVGMPGNQSGLSSVKTVLPVGIGADLTRITRACPYDEFKASGCTDNALTGSVTGTLGILDEPITGRVVLVKYPGETLPGIGLDLAGRFSARIAGHTKVEPSGQVSVTLSDLPDAPITDLVLTFASGAQSALKVSKLFCPAGTATFAFTLTGQTGASLAKSVDAPCGAGAVLSERSHRSKLSLKLTKRKTTKPSLALKATGPVGTKLTSITLTLPKGMSVKKSLVKKTSVTGGRLTASSSRTIRVALRGTGRRITTAQLRGGTLLLSSKVRRSTSKLKLRLVLRYGDGVVERRTVTAK
jgi:hypothetical protein